MMVFHNDDIEDIHVRWTMNMDPRKRVTRLTRDMKMYIMINRFDCDIDKFYT